MKSTPPLIINLTRDKLAFCSSASPSSLVLPLPSTSVKDLEVINSSELTTLIKNFISTHQIRPSPVIVILSQDVCFEKNLSEVPVTDRAAAAQNFIDSVPLVSVSSKVFRIQNSEVLVVINRNLYEALKESFTSLGFAVMVVVPGLVLGGVGIKEEISATSCQLILKKEAFLKDNSFLSDLGSDDDMHQKGEAFLAAADFGAQSKPLRALIRRFVQEVYRQVSRVDVLINNASIF